MGVIGMLRFVLTVFFFLLGLSPASVLPPTVSWAQQVAGVEARGEDVPVKHVALVIGNYDYDYKDIKGEKVNRTDPKEDMRLMINTLKDLNFDIIDHDNINRECMVSAIREFSDTLKRHGKNSVGLFYFSGHGIQLKGFNYLIPLEASVREEKHLNLVAIKFQDVLRLISHAGNDITIVILDACRKNPYLDDFDDRKPGLAKPAGNFSEFTLTGGFSKGTLVAFSNSPDKVVDTGDNFYVPALTKQMAVLGQGWLGMFDKAAKEVIDRTNRKQVPRLWLWHDGSPSTAPTTAPNFPKKTTWTNNNPSSPSTAPNFPKKTTWTNNNI